MTDIILAIGGVSGECQTFEVIGGSLKTKGIYTRAYGNATLDQTNLPVWKKPSEDRFIFNKEDSTIGWRIGKESHIETGSYYYKSKGV